MKIEVFKGALTANFKTQLDGSFVESQAKERTIK